ncbi:hypothetical protein PC129_g10037 [Phytophthora cactorum]|uniref:Uncharacterized protein n=1 Tax=Phytophthora cactorum TaxID=29920 RepID=A0A8T1GGK7_9STRA|nr:hypothetical protein Pcac1_g13947 [Phytophthora cactorum]KAG2830376.1 hypothetical protein PC112_g7709 [Phytophthora cactorum]KAG2832806.1 hypothetical protein PC111_g6463 [Phytophthora cactorum]KAG2860658.1 hypothetical protein PC113_g7857 [Phytophthora cactorum]KAG2902414.1 hypothetical protein PC114_g12779 [Phytophthora cactorum]
MGVVFQPIDHHEAIQHEASPELAPQSWSRKVQPISTTTTLALSTCPLFSLQDSADKSLDMCWSPDSYKRKHIQVSMMQSPEDQQRRPLKRWASMVISPRRGLKRQRVAVECSYQSVSCDKDQSDRASVGSPRSLQYALPGLTSHDTLRVLHAMHAIPSELRHLNGSASRNHLRRRCKVRQVFGWRHLLCQEEEDEQLARRVVWKSAKALDSMRMRPLARQIWRSSTEATGGMHGETGEVLYIVNNITRVVHSTKKQYGSRRRTRDQVWLECYLDDGLQVCVARKELRQFSQYRAPEASATECQGFLVRPVYTRAIKSRLAGCSLQCLRAVDAGDCGMRSAPALKQRLIDDLPQLTLQCEEDYLYDLVQAPQALLDSVFAEGAATNQARHHKS